MNHNKKHILDELHGLMTAIGLCARKKDTAKLRSLFDQLEAWGRDLADAAVDANIVTTLQNEAEDLRHKLRASKVSFDATVSAYKNLLDAFDTFRTTIDGIHRIKRFDDLPQAIDTVRHLHTMSSLRLVLDQELFGEHVPKEIVTVPAPLLRERLLAFTPAPHAPRLYLGETADLEHPSFFLGANNEAATGSCFIFALKHKYVPGKIIGFLAACDPDPERYAPDKATDFLGHFCDILACTLITALEHAQLEELSVRDTLTGINNRTYLERHAPRILNFAERKNFPVHLLFIDLNGFKAVNDTLGHDAGDMILMAVAQAIQSMVRKYDLFVRLGGDEFVIILPDTDEAMAGSFRNRLNETLARIDVGPACGLDTDLRISASIGMAKHQPGQSLDELIRDADRLMYANKPTRPRA